MKTVITILLVTVCITLQAQYVQTVNPGRSVLVDQLIIDTMDVYSQDDTTFKFRMPNGCSAYSIQIIEADSLDAAGSAFLYGTNDGAITAAIGDSLIITATDETISRYWTGTTFPYAIGFVKIRVLTATEGKVTVILNYNE